MKSLILNIDEQVEKELTSYIMTKKVCANPLGIGEEFIMKILQALNEKDTNQITLTVK